MAFHNEIGRLGEDYACDVLRGKGLKILDRNWRMGHLEMDIICCSKTELIFVEVKTRTSVYAGRSPESYVDADKQHHMVAAANAYMRYHQMTDKVIRFDIIGLLVQDGKVQECSHLEGAFHPHLRTKTDNSYSGEWRRHTRGSYSAFAKRK